jgi:hypothetical protein
MADIALTGTKGGRGVTGTHIVKFILLADKMGTLFSLRTFDM